MREERHKTIYEKQPLVELEVPGYGRQNREQAHLIRLSLHVETLSLNIEIGLRFKENEEGIFAVIDVIHREIETGFEMFAFANVPIEGKIESMVRGQPVRVAVAVLGDDGARQKIVTHRDGHRIAGREHPYRRDIQLVGQNVVTEIDGDIMPTVVLGIEGLSAVKVISPCRRVLFR